MPRHQSLIRMDASFTIAQMLEAIASRTRTVVLSHISYPHFLVNIRENQGDVTRALAGAGHPPFGDQRSVLITQTKTPYSSVPLFP